MRTFRIVRAFHNDPMNREFVKGMVGGDVQFTNRQSEAMTFASDEEAARNAGLVRAWCRFLGDMQDRPVWVMGERNESDDDDGTVGEEPRSVGCSVSAKEDVDARSSGIVGVDRYASA